MTERIGLGHIERIIGSDQHVTGTEYFDKCGELLWRENDAVDKDLLEVMRRWMRQISLQSGERPRRGRSARIGAEISAAMHGKQLQVRMALEYAIEDEIMKRKRRLERIADHIIEIERGETLAFGEAIRMNDDERPELLGLVPEWCEVAAPKVRLRRHW